MTDKRIQPDQNDPVALGKYLRGARKASGMTLRGVEQATEKSVTNGYLSQIEAGNVKQPSPRILHFLALAYGIDFGELLERAGHTIRSTETSKREESLNGFPLRSLEDLDEEETAAVIQYIEFLKSRR